MAAKNSPTDAVTTADISLTVRAYDHVGLGSPPPNISGYRAASDCDKVRALDLSSRGPSEAALARVEVGCSPASTVAKR